MRPRRCESTLIDAYNAWQRKHSEIGIKPAVIEQSKHAEEERQRNALLAKRSKHAEEERQRNDLRAKQYEMPTAEIAKFKLAIIIGDPLPNGRVMRVMRDEMVITDGSIKLHQLQNIYPSKGDSRIAELFFSDFRSILSIDRTEQFVIEIHTPTDDITGIQVSGESKTETEKLRKTLIDAYNAWLRKHSEIGIKPAVIEQSKIPEEERQRNDLRAKQYEMPTAEIAKFKLANTYVNPPPPFDRVIHDEMVITDGSIKLHELALIYPSKESSNIGEVFFSNFRSILSIDRTEKFKIEIHTSTDIIGFQVSGENKTETEKLRKTLIDAYNAWLRKHSEIGIKPAVIEQ